MSERHTDIVENSARPPALTLHWPDELATQAWASRLAEQLCLWPSGQDACLALYGNLGAGKTTLVRHLLRVCGVSGRIKSPSYAVLEPHEGQCHGAVWPIWHFDFYRFNDPGEWEDAGFRDVLAGPGLKLMEWPEKVAGLLPAFDWVIHIHALNESARAVTIEAHSARGAQWLQAWPKEFSNAT